ncbi:hypothetical protein [Actinopolymorpha singaporensis]|uniref:adenosine deaminase n=1 Tax=Actinopolymorpha singaporensis TaxID=117157 RepID=A0A1H1MKN2_9ACTN|nr:hypothetical protein [Actinopolymorpha singaporensis]SDR87190.1 Adenosine/AMP deaminase [Actinopolymorpha singaporensis]
MVLPPDHPIAALPKADLHVHQEPTPHLDRVLAHREGRQLYDWAAWRRRLVAEFPPGPDRLARVGTMRPVPLEVDDDDELFVARIADVMYEHARAGGCYIEVRCGGDVVLRDRFMELFRRAERQVQVDSPALRAEALAIVMVGSEPPLALAAKVDGCIRLAGEGLAGVDLMCFPYRSEADWSVAHRLAERFAEAGLGITAHAGELSTDNIAAAAATPGLTRIGHGIHAIENPALVELLIGRDITLECALSCNVLFGVVPSLAEHPLVRLIDAGVKVTLATDDPVQVGTTIGAEYEAAASLGLSHDQLLQLTRNAIEAAFTTDRRRKDLLAELDAAAMSAASFDNRSTGQPPNVEVGS